MCKNLMEKSEVVRLMNGDVTGTFRYVCKSGNCVCMDGFEIDSRYAKAWLLDEKNRLSFDIDKKAALDAQIAAMWGQKDAAMQEKAAALAVLIADKMAEMKGQK